MIIVGGNATRESIKMHEGVVLRLFSLFSSQRWK
jgi:hypothetical protein